MIQHDRDADRRCHAIAELGAFPEQGAGSQQLALRRARVEIPIVHAAAEAAGDEERVSRAEKVAPEVVAPGQSDIAVAGIAGSVDGAADMGPRRTDPGEK